MHPAGAQSQPSPTSPEQLEASLSIAKSELTLWQHKVAAFEVRQTKERGFIAALGRVVLDGQEGAQVTISDYLRAHKGSTDAELNIMRLQVEKLRGQTSLLQRMIEELQQPKSPLLDPGAGRRLVVPSVR